MPGLEKISWYWKMKTRAMRMQLRSIIKSVAIAAIFSLCFASDGFLTAQVSKRSLSPGQIAQRSFPSVVVLITEDLSGQQTALGSGFFVANDMVATNYHVIKGAARIWARRIDQRGQLSVAELVGSDEENDISILRLVGGSGRPLMLARGPQVGIGDEVFVIGNPEGLEGTFSQGIVSAIRGRQYIQITAPISHGSSGGPVLNRYAEVIGIALGTFENGQNLNFAVPVGYLSRLVAQTTSFSARSRASVRGSVRLSAKAYYDRGEILFAQGDLQGALRSYKQALRINPRYADALSAVAWTNEALGSDSQAIEYYRKAIRIRPGDFFPYEQLGRLYDQQGLINQEVALALDRVRAIPGDFQSYWSLAELYEKLGRDQDAINVYKAAIRTLPTEKYAYIFLADLYEKKVMYAEAAELITRVSKLDTYKISDAYDHFQFNIYLALRESDLDAYKQAVRLAPNNASYHMVLGMLYLRIGDRNSAIQEQASLQRLDQDMAFFFSYILLHCDGRRCTKQ